MGNHYLANGGSDIYDVVGVGFGPAGIALAVAMADADEERGRSIPNEALFFEAAPDSSWQPDMLLAGTDIQHHFLRDFATPRNPRSRYTFPNYLKESGRLFAFGLLEGNPGRIEWNDYCQWVARQVDRNTRYGHRVMKVEPARSAGHAVDLLRVEAQGPTGVVTSAAARNVVLCTGRVPNVPEVFEPWTGQKVFHAQRYLSSVRTLEPGAVPTIAVVGSGQNAIEILLDLLDRYPESRIVSINRNSGFRLCDRGHFSNRVYFPEDVDYFHSLAKPARQALLGELKYTNYSTVDADVSYALYLRMYEDELLGRNRMQMVNRSVVTEVGSRRGRLDLVVEDIYRHVEEHIRVDAVFLCTGYLDEPVPALLDGLRPYLDLDEDGHPRISRDYQVSTTRELTAGIFVNGFTELTHGISDAASFSMMALKAERTLARLEARRAEGVPPDRALAGHAHGRLALEARS